MLLISALFKIYLINFKRILVFFSIKTISFIPPVLNISTGGIPELPPYISNPLLDGLLIGGRPGIDILLASTGSNWVDKN